MFKSIQSGLSKFFTKERVLILIIFVILAWALLSYSGSKTNLYDNMDVGMTSGSGTSSIIPQPTVSSNVVSDSSVSNNTSVPSGYNSQSVSNPSHLLPVDQNSAWSALNPNTMNSGSIIMPDLLQAGYHIGLDTIGQTLRNPNLQLRSDPLISKQDIGPWNNSTIEADYGRVPLEIGVGSK